MKYKILKWLHKECVKLVQWLECKKFEACTVSIDDYKHCKPKAKFKRKFTIVSQVLTPALYNETPRKTTNIL